MHLRFLHWDGYWSLRRLHLLKWWGDASDIFLYDAVRAIVCSNWDWPESDFDLRENARAFLSAYILMLTNGDSIRGRASSFLAIRGGDSMRTSCWPLFTAINGSTVTGVWRPCAQSAWQRKYRSRECQNSHAHWRKAIYGRVCLLNRI